MSQTELAKAVNASRDIIGKYERNENAPSIGMAQKIADVFGVIVGYLLGKRALPSITKTILNLWKILKSLILTQNQSFIL